MLLIAASPLNAAEISDLAWLSGCWSYDDSEPGSGEYWMPPAGETILAVSRTVRGSKTVAFEFLRITTTEANSRRLVASPFGQSPASFELLLLTENEVIFENPEHDFPQRILYQRNGDHLVGGIEGVSKGEQLAATFPMTRIACEDLAP